MKAKTDVSTFTWTNGYSEGGTTVNNSGSGSYTREDVWSTTSTYQNSGDHKTGTPFAYGVTKIVPFSGSYNYTVTGTNPVLTAFGNGQFYSPFQTITGHNDVSNVDNEAINDLLEKIRGTIDLSVDAFQIGKTIRMIKRPIDSLTQIVRAVKARSGRSKSFASAWLEYQYGWRPLVSTIYEIAGQAANINADGPSTQLFTGKAKGHSMDSRTIRMSAGGTEHDIQVTSHAVYGSKYFALMQLSGAEKARLTSTYTSMNPASIAWELLPYSFVVDWVVDVSSYLRSVETAALYNSLLLKAWKSQLTVVNTEHVGLPRAFSGATGNLSGSGTVMSMVFGRSEVHGLPTPTAPVTSSPADLSWQRLTSAIALLITAFR